MINLNDYCSVDWPATADNIRGYIKIKTVTIKALAEAMFVSRRTIENWCSGKTRPSIDELIFFN